MISVPGFQVLSSFHVSASLILLSLPEVQLSSVCAWPLHLRLTCSFSAQSPREMAIGSGNHSNSKEFCFFFNLFKTAFYFPLKSFPTFKILNQRKTEIIVQWTFEYLLVRFTNCHNSVMFAFSLYIIYVSIYTFFLNHLKINDRHISWDVTPKFLFIYS